MPMQRFLIAPFKEGEITRDKPWLIPDQAFEQLNNAYVWRGRLRKRYGALPLYEGVGINEQQFFTRLSINLGDTDVNGDIMGTVDGAPYSAGQAFYVSDGTNFEVFTVQTTGTPVVMLATGSATTHTFDTTTGDFDIQGSIANADVYFFPALPVMGFHNPENSVVNDEPTWAWDTRFVYEYSAATNHWERITGEATAGASMWSGSNSQFFWAANWRGEQIYEDFTFVTNNNIAEVMRYYDGTVWHFYQPQHDVTTGDKILTCLIIVEFKERLLLLNTYEETPSGPQRFRNRVRYSQDGSPIETGGVFPFDTSITGVGGFEDASTKEAIVSVEFIRDRLIVYFERSTWELVYTGNQIRPFIWQQINTELGAESTFSIVPFDRYCLGVGNTGIHACTGTNVERIDEKIPNLIFSVYNDDNGLDRVWGIRDYYGEMVFWTYPDRDFNPTFPTKVLAYNYINNNWAVWDDTITAFGYHQNVRALTWATWMTPWNQNIQPWESSASASKFRQVIAGNQEGYTFLLFQDQPLNSYALQISNILIGASPTIVLTIYNHNLQPNLDFIYIQSAEGITELNNKIYQVVSVIDDDNITISETIDAGTYTGNGVIVKVSRIDILTKQYNFFNQLARNVFVSKTNFLVDKTSPSGEITVDYWLSDAEFSMIDSSTATGAILGTNVLRLNALANIPFEAQQDQFWHTVYFQAEGEFVQMRIHYTIDQMLDSTNFPAFENLVINAMTIWARPTSDYSQ